MSCHLHTKLFFHSQSHTEQTSIKGELEGRGVTRERKERKKPSKRPKCMDPALDLGIPSFPQLHTLHSLWVYPTQNHFLFTMWCIIFTVTGFICPVSMYSTYSTLKKVNNGPKKVAVYCCLTTFYSLLMLML